MTSEHETSGAMQPQLAAAADVAMQVCTVPLLSSAAKWLSSACSAGQQKALHGTQGTCIDLANFNARSSAALSDSGSLRPVECCPAGKAIAPIYEELSQKYPQVKFLKIDIDNQDMQQVVNDHCITGVVSLTPLHTLHAVILHA